MKKEGIVRRVAKELDDSGYSTVVVRNMRTCIDVFATKLGRTVAIKAVHNIDSAGRAGVESLYRIASFIGAEPLIVGGVSQNGRLGEGVIYRRFSVRCMASSSIDLLGEEVTARLAARTVGVKVRVDGARLRKLRKNCGVSAARLAKMTGISREAVYRYERCSGFATGRVALRLGRALGEAVTMDAREGEPKRVEASRMFGTTGMAALDVSNAPFDVIVKNENRYEISYDTDSRTMAKRAELFSSLSGLLESNYPFFVSRRREGRIMGIPILRQETVRGLRSEKELVEALYALS